MRVCLCVCVYDCVGSQRVTDPEYDGGTAVVSKGGWGPFPSITCSVFQKLVFLFVVFFSLHFSLFSFCMEYILCQNVMLKCISYIHTYAYAYILALS